MQIGSLKYLKVLSIMILRFDEKYEQSRKSGWHPKPEEQDEFYKQCEEDWAAIAALAKEIYGKVVPKKEQKGPKPGDAGEQRN